ncbi:hypothetical protein RJT34_16746 [Clitoria ternatea]|uniref:Uncharacterized protein n=1 Tax=Clitoria ternatea TaxID=43366 RepID=A0AAN9PDY1_CLITE
MSITQNLITSISSSSSAFLAPSTFNSRRQVSFPVKSVSVCKCVMTPQEAETAYKTKVDRNLNMGKLQAGYLFPEVARRSSAHLLKYPDAQVISLRIGDTIEPIPEVISFAMANPEGSSSKHSRWSLKGTTALVTGGIHGIGEKQVAFAFNGKLNILINNVGANVRKPTIEFTAEEYLKVMSTNLDSAYHLSQLTYSLFKASENGNIVFIFFVAGFTSIGSRSIYAASKAAMD